jgi:acyl-CoA thioester hydrolase
MVVSGAVAVHTLPIRVYYEDTDAAGIVYHASYIRFAERGRTEMLRDADFNHSQLLKDKGIAFAVVAININYNAPAQLDDLLAVKTRITRLGGASMEMQQDIYKEDRLITEIKVTLVCIDKDFKAVRLPPEIRELFGT